jgi:hypothetical protein
MNETDARPACSCCDAWLDEAGNCPSRHDCTGTCDLDADTREL